MKDVGSNTPSNFLTKFSISIILDNNIECVIGLNRVINMSFTWFNINTGYNQTIKYSSDSGSTFSEITFAPGEWNYLRINEFIHYKTNDSTLGVLKTLKTNH